MIRHATAAAFRHLPLVTMIPSDLDNLKTLSEAAFASMVKTGRSLEQTGGPGSRPKALSSVIDALAELV